MISALFLSLAFVVQSPDALVIRDANILYSEAEAFVARSKATKMFMLRNGGKTWMPMRKDTDHLDLSGQWSGNTSQVAFVYVRAGRTLMVALTNASMSGDWLTSTSCVYRADGSMAKCEQTYSALAPEEGVAVRTWIFDAAGKQLIAKTKCTDMAGKKEMLGEAARLFLEGASPFLPDPLPFRSVRSLPFASLISIDSPISHVPVQLQVKPLSGKYELDVSASDRSVIEAAGHALPYLRFSGANKWEMKIIVNRMSGTYTRRRNTITMVKTLLNGKKPTGDARMPTKAEVLEDGKAVSLGGQVFRKIE